MNEEATDVYQLERESVAFWRRLPRVVAVFVANLFSLGAGPANPGGARVCIIEKRTGRVVSTVVEALGDDGQGTVSTISADLAAMTADEFARKWL